MERTDCVYYRKKIIRKGNETVIGFKCLAGMPTLGGCPPICDKYAVEDN